MRRRTMTAVTTVLGLATTMVLFLASAASAQAGYPPPPQPPKVAQTLPPPPPVRKVAFTGADTLRWVVIGAVLVVLGALLVAFNRRRTRVAA